MVLTPGSRVASWVQSRPFSGNSRMVPPLTSAPRLEVANSMPAAAPTTCTCSLVVPRARATFTGSWAPTVRAMPVTTARENPGAVTVTS